MRHRDKPAIGCVLVVTDYVGDEFIVLADHDGRYIAFRFIEVLAYVPENAFGKP